MMSLKKLYGEELLQLTIILSLLRVDPDSYLGSELPISVESNDFGSSWGQSTAHIHNSHSQFHRRLYVHPKCIDSVLLNYEQELFADLNALGRYNRLNDLHHNVHNRNITAYLLNVETSSHLSPANAEDERTSSTAPVEEPGASVPGTSLETLTDDAVTPPASELTQEVFTSFLLWLSFCYETIIETFVFDNILSVFYKIYI